MNTVKDLVDFLTDKYPLYLASNFDQGKVGLQFGSLNKEVKKVMLTLDGSTEVIKEAIINNVDLLITHHPFMFNPLYNMDYDNPLMEKIILVIKNDLNVFSMHTNFDVASFGMNEILCNKLGLTNIKSDQFQIDQNAFLRYGDISPLTLGELTEKVKKDFNVCAVRIVGNKDKIIKKVAIVGGSGSFELYKAKKAGCDAFITGEIKHDKALDAIDLDIALIEVSHSVERLYKEEVYKILNNAFPNINFILSTKDVNPFN